MARREKAGWLLAVGIFILSFVFYALAGRFVDAQTRIPVHDLILDNLGPMNVLWMLG